MPRKGKAAIQPGRSHRTRSRFPIVTNPEDTERALAKTLSSLGLYAANTLGDGNCLFRALADQFYGDPSRHAHVRADVCNYLEAHASYFQNYVVDCEDDDLAAHFSSHVLAMRRLGTYGDDMELTAFSKMTGREIRVVQPGLVYVVADESPATSGKRSPASAAAQPPPAPSSPLSATMSPRERRKMAREAKGKARENPDEVIDVDAEVPLATGTLWICYHSYEHYSSARNVGGPHTGLPMTVPRVIAASLSDGSTPSLTDDSDDSASEGGPATADERLLLASLPQPSPYGTLAAARALIAAHEGSWELALEAAQQELLRVPIERKRSASPSPHDESSPRQRLREDSESDTSDSVSTDEDAIAETIIPPSELAPPDHHAASVARKPRGRPRKAIGARLAPKAATRDTRARARERESARASHPLTRLQRANRGSSSSDVSVAEGIRTLRV